MISFKDVSKRYPDGTVAVGGLTLETRSGEITVLLGSSGCGKTTVLRMINRLIEPTSGTIELDGRDVASIPVHELRRGIGYVIQHAGLFPHRTVAENIATVPRLLGWDRRHRRARSLELIELVGLERDMADRYPGQLSGGQQQRVGVARALAADPPVLLMDEPFGAVDPVRRGALQREFRRLQRDLGKTVVFVTHDVDEAVLLGDRIAVMRQGGKVVQYGTPEALLARPADDFVASFLGGTRGLKLLSLRSAADVPGGPVGPDGIAGWGIRTDPAGRPTTWTPLRGDGIPAVVEPVGPGGSLRDLLDSALASPAHAAVRVDHDGVLVGAVPFAALAEHLSAPEQTAAEHLSTPEQAVAEHLSATEQAAAEHPSAPKQAAAEHLSGPEQAVAEAGR
jgi:osmoprotectant transport system ATP-binding protein